MIKLTDFLISCKVSLNLENFKIHLATGKSNPPINAFFKGDFKSWQEYQTRKNFRKEMVIGLIELSRNKWLFAGVYKVLGYKKVSEKHIAYSTELIPNQEELIGRIIVYHERKGRAPYLNGKKDGGEFFISELKEKKLTVEEFPGYNDVFLTYDKLKIVITQNISSWKGALANIKGVYLISDTLTGKLYVGSAIGDSGIWQRWSSYVNTGHGGNKELRNHLKTKKHGYEKNFTYTILEIADTHTSDEYILQRESHWKEVLLSREFGYNAN
ncbi:MAG: GIY-YIG nuclease family protein [Melioribacteraceae bacterium]